MFDKLPYRLHQFRFFYSEQSRIPEAWMYGLSISSLWLMREAYVITANAGFGNLGTPKRPHY